MTYYVLKKGKNYYSYSEGSRSNYWAPNLLEVIMLTDVLDAFSRARKLDGAMVMKLNIEEVQVFLKIEEGK